MALERWGTLSVRDHLDLEALVANVIPVRPVGCSLSFRHERGKEVVAKELGAGSFERPPK